MNLWTSIIGVRLARDNVNKALVPPHFSVRSGFVQTGQSAKNRMKPSLEELSAEINENLGSSQTTFIEDLTSLGANKVVLHSNNRQKFEVTYQFATTATQVYGGRTIGSSPNGCSITEGCSNIVVSVDDPKWGVMRLPIFMSAVDGNVAVESQHPPLQPTNSVREFIKRGFGYTPTTIPTAEPTGSPTTTPSSRPSLSPLSDNSTRKPSTLPPTLSPTVAPSAAPSDSPNETPPTTTDSESDICKNNPGLSVCRPVPTGKNPIIQVNIGGPITDPDFDLGWFNNEHFQPWSSRRHLMSRSEYFAPSRRHKLYLRPVIDKGSENITWDYISRGVDCSAKSEYWGDWKKKRVPYNQGCPEQDGGGALVLNNVSYTLALPFTYGLPWPNVTDEDMTQSGALLVHGSFLTNTLIGELENEMDTVISTVGVSQDAFGDVPPDPLPWQNWVTATVNWMLGITLVVCNNYGAIGRSESLKGLAVRFSGIWLASIIYASPLIAGIVNERNVKQYDGFSWSVLTLSRHMCADQNPSWSSMQVVGCVRATAMGYLEMHRSIPDNTFLAYAVTLVVAGVLTLYFSVNYGVKQWPNIGAIPDDSVAVSEARSPDALDSGDADESKTASSSSLMTNESEGKTNPNPELNVERNSAELSLVESTFEKVDSVDPEEDDEKDSDGGKGYRLVSPEKVDTASMRGNSGVRGESIAASDDEAVAGEKTTLSLKAKSGSAESEVSSTRSSSSIDLEAPRAGDSCGTSD